MLTAKQGLSCVDVVSGVTELFLLVYLGRRGVFGIGLLLGSGLRLILMVRLAPATKVRWSDGVVVVVIDCEISLSAKM